MDEKLYQQEFEKANRQEIEEQEARMEQKVREIEAQEARMQHCPRAEEITIGDILGRIDTILIERDYIQQVIDSINHIPVNESPNGGFDGQARGQALEGIVKCRETTNQRVLSMLEKMYDDLTASQQTSQVSRINKIPREERKALAQKMADNLTSNPDISCMSQQQLDLMFDRIEKLMSD